MGKLRHEWRIICGTGCILEHTFSLHLLENIGWDKNQVGHTGGWLQGVLQRGLIYFEVDYPGDSLVPRPVLMGVWGRDYPGDHLLWGPIYFVTGPQNMLVKNHCTCISLHFLYHDVFLTSHHQHNVLSRFPSHTHTHIHTPHITTLFQCSHSHCYSDLAFSFWRKPW